MCCSLLLLFFFFFNDTATTEIYTLSLHDALPISLVQQFRACHKHTRDTKAALHCCTINEGLLQWMESFGCCQTFDRDRKSTRLNSSHLVISYAVFCLKKKKSRNTIHSESDQHVKD